MNATIPIAKPAHPWSQYSFGYTRQARNVLALRLLLAILLLLTTSFATAADVSGKWDGALEFKGEDGQTQTAPAHADLKQENKLVTGKIWKEGGQQFEIDQGQVSGNEISFRFSAPEGEDEQIVIHSVMLILVTATEMKGTLKFDTNGQKFNGKLTLTRQK